jgi:hypothetical protein
MRKQACLDASIFLIFVIDFVGASQSSDGGVRAYVDLARGSSHVCFVVEAGSYTGGASELPDFPTLLLNHRRAALESCRDGFQSVDCFI